MGLYHPPLDFKNTISEVNQQKYLGIVVVNHFSFQEHLKMILSKDTSTSSRN